MRNSVGRKVKSGGSSEGYNAGRVDLTVHNEARRLLVPGAIDVHNTACYLGKGK